MSKYGARVSQAGSKSTKSAGSAFDWSTWKGGVVTFVNCRVETLKTKYLVTGSLGQGGPFVKVYVDQNADADTLGLADLQAGFTFTAADVKTMTVVEYDGQNGSGKKWKVKGVDFGITGFPTAAAAKLVKSVKVTASS